MTPEVDKFVKSSKQWQDEIVKLRSIILTTKLEESLKWSKPCYSYKDKNVAIIQPFKSCLALMFFKGTLLKDSKDVLVDVGQHSQAARRIEFRSEQEIIKLASTIKAYIKEAIEIEKSDKKVDLKKKPEPIPDELKQMFSKRPKLKKAFDALTPGRQRGYILHFSSAKQSSTRISRIEKSISRILEGKGVNDR